MNQRPQRLRKSATLRELTAETTLSLKNLIQPYFLTTQNKNAIVPIPSFSNVSLYGVETLSRQIEADLEHGLSQFLLFCSVERESKKPLKDIDSFEPPAHLSDISTLKKRFGSRMTLFLDVCLCPFNPQGHCGIVEGEKIDNDSSLLFLSEQSLWFAEAGADFVAPSDMMDGRVAAIRSKLDEHNFKEVGILSYTVKYASSYYWPFREALDSAPQGYLTDRKTYQMDYRNKKEALRELKLDEAEGADIVMVKPALCYLDIIAMFQEHSNLPVAAYSVSGEYEWVKQVAKLNLAPERDLFLENLTSIRRAGASIIITYAASEIAKERWI